MRQQISQCDLAPRRHDAHASVSHLGDCRGCPLWNETTHRIIQIQFAFLQQRQNHHTGQRLSLRSDAKQTRRGHGPTGLPIAKANRCLVDRFAILQHQRDSAGQFALVHIGLQDTIDPRQAFPDLKAIMFSGEAHSGIPWIRRMEQFWGVPLGEWYGSTQAAGSHMFSCEAGLHFEDGRPRMLHNLEHRILFEVLDLESGLPVGPGEAGEVFLTNLYNEDFPIIRFRNYDRVKYQPAAYCDCGRPFAGIESGSTSRVDDMIKIRGQNVWPDAITTVVFKHAQVEEYQGRVWVDDTGRERIQVRVEFREDQLSASERDRLREAVRAEIKTTTDLTMDIVEAEHGSLPRFEQKARRWKDERQQSRQQAVERLGDKP